MAESNEPQQSETREQKRAQFAEPARSKKSTNVILIAALVVLVAGAVYVVADSLSEDAGTGGAVPIEETAGELRIRVEQLSDGRAKFFTHATGGKAVRFFVIRSSDGIYRAALDACDVCYHAKKGYEQQGDEMVCRNCGQRFPSSLINEVRGGCNPVGLSRNVAGEYLVINKSELERLSNYF